MHRVSIDVGGTFTDIVVSRIDGSIRTMKILSTPGDYSRGIIDGLENLVAREVIAPHGVNNLIHAFTVATNALLTGEGAKVGLITTHGFRDVLEIGRLRMPQLYNMDWDKPRPLVPRRLRCEVRERISSTGEVVTPLVDEDVAVAVRKLAAAEVDSIAICLLHAYADPVHELKVAEIIRKLAPRLSISVSHQVLPEIREFERTSTTVVNAFVKPVVDRYLGSLESGLRRIGIAAPLMIMQSAGGIMKSSAAREFPAHCVESGPAAGAVGAAALGKSLGESNIIAFDMGGTTAKACLVEDGEPRLAAEMEVGSGINVGQRLLKGGGYLVRAPAIDLAEIGAGGGSLAWIDKGGALRVGPRSAGAVPGPACYGRGGSAPTVTDANVVLGFLNRHHLLDGDMPIDAAAAERAITACIARPLDLSVLEAAHGIHTVANATMARAIQAVSSEIGRSPGEFILVAFGGSGPVHAAILAQHAGISQIIIPPASGVFSAYGLLFARIEHRLVKAYWVDSRAVNLEKANELASTLRSEAVEMMAAEGLDAAEVEFRFAFDLRYARQSSELAVDIENPPITARTLHLATELFHQEHERTYGYCSRDERTQIVNIRLRVRGRAPASAAISPAAAAGPTHRRSDEPRKVFFGPASGWADTPVLRREALGSAERHGPMVIEEYDTTIVVPPRAVVRKDSSGSVRIDLSSTQ